MESYRSRAIKYLFLLFPILSFTTAYAADKKLDTGYTCSTDNFTTNSPFTTNLNSLLASLQAKAPSTGFYKDSVGQNPYQLYGVLQCRGDLSSKDCASCAKNAAREALQSCNNSIWGNVWLQTCSLHYSTENLFGVLDRNATMITFDQVPDAEDVRLKGLELMDKLASSAPNKPLMFQTDVLDAGTSVKRYGMSQCRRDISKDSCETCLKASLTTFRQKIIGEREWEIYGVSCSMWYHDYSFFSDNINSKVSSQYSAAGRLLSGRRVAVVLVVMLMPSSSRVLIAKLVSQKMKEYQSSKLSLKKHRQETRIKKKDFCSSLLISKISAVVY